MRWNPLWRSILIFMHLYFHEKYLYMFTISWYNIMILQTLMKYFVKMQLHKKTPSRIRTILIHWVTLGNLIWSHIGGRSFTVFAISCFLFFKQIFKNLQNIMWSFRNINYKQFYKGFDPIVERGRGHNYPYLIVSLFFQWLIYYIMARKIGLE